MNKIIFVIAVVAVYVLILNSSYLMGQTHKNSYIAILENPQVLERYAINLAHEQEMSFYHAYAFLHKKVEDNKITFRLSPVTLEEVKHELVSLNLHHKLRFW